VITLVMKHPDKGFHAAPTCFP